MATRSAASTVAPRLRTSSSSASSLRRSATAWSWSRRDSVEGPTPPRALDSDVAAVWWRSAASAARAASTAARSCATAASCCLTASTSAATLRWRAAACKQARGTPREAGQRHVTSSTTPHLLLRERPRRPPVLLTLPCVCDLMAEQVTGGGQLLRLKRGEGANTVNSTGLVSTSTAHTPSESDDTSTSQKTRTCSSAARARDSARASSASRADCSPSTSSSSARVAGPAVVSSTASPGEACRASAMAALVSIANPPDAAAVVGEVSRRSWPSQRRELLAARGTQPSWCYLHVLASRPHDARERPLI